MVARSFMAGWDRAPSTDASRSDAMIVIAPTRICDDRTNPWAHPMDLDSQTTVIDGDETEWRLFGSFSPAPGVETPGYHQIAATRRNANRSRPGAQRVMIGEPKQVTIQGPNAPRLESQRFSTSEPHKS